MPPTAAGPPRPATPRGRLPRWRGTTNAASTECLGEATRPIVSLRHSELTPRRDRPPAPAGDAYSRPAEPTRSDFCGGLRLRQAEAVRPTRAQCGKRNVQSLRIILLSPLVVGPPERSASPRERLFITVVSMLLIGLVLAWKWEGVGSLLILSALGLFATADEPFLLNIVVAPWLVTGLSYLVCWLVIDITRLRKRLAATVDKDRGESHR